VIEKFKQFSIKAKLMVIIMTASGTALLLACAAFITYDLFSLRQNLVKELDIAASLVGSSCDAMIEFRNDHEANIALKAFSAQPEIVLAGIYTKEGLFAMYPDKETTPSKLPKEPGPPGHRFEGGFLHLTREIFSGGEQIASIYVRSSISHAKTLPIRYIGIAGLVLILSSLAAFWISSVLQKEISQPLNDLLRVAESVATTQNYTVRAPRETDDEVGKLVDGFNNMLSQVQARDTALQEAQNQLERKVDERTKDLQLEIIQRQNTQQALERSKELAESASRAKSEFLAVMSHEIRTPMNGVIGMTSLLSETQLDREQREFVETIRMSGESLMVIINDILDFSKIEAGKMELEHQPYDLRPSVEECLDLFMPKASSKGLELAYSIATNVPPRVIGDISRTRQILANLIGNAIKFTEQGEVEVSVRLESTSPTSSDQILLRFDIRDTGIGIPEDKLNRLFLAFSQVDSSTTRKYGGTGLGLAISKRLCELMGGTLSVTSKVGQGSTFSVTVKVGTNLPGQSSIDPIHHSPEAIRDRSVLYVDDNKTNLRIFQSYAQLWGLRCTLAQSGREAEDLLRGGASFDAIVLDVHMPDMNGLQLARRIRGYAPIQEVPIIFFTSGGTADLRKQATELAVSSILQKPLKPAALLADIRDALGSKAREIAAAKATVEIAPSTNESRHSRPLSIIVAEDNAINQLVAKQLLHKLGYRADVAGNGNEVLNVLAERSYEVILMDVQMPELNGCDATRVIRRSFPKAKQPWIIAMTANAMNEDREMCLSAGMDDYLSKPVRLSDLDTALRKAWAMKSATPAEASRA